MLQKTNWQQDWTVLEGVEVGGAGGGVAAEILSSEQEKCGCESKGG